MSFILVVGSVGDVIVVLHQSDEVYLEAGVQNITSGPLCLEKVELEPSPYFSGEVLGTTTGAVLFPIPFLSLQTVSGVACDHNITTGFPVLSMRKVLSGTECLEKLIVNVMMTEPLQTQMFKN